MSYIYYLENGMLLIDRYDVTIFSHRGFHDILLYGGAYCYNGEYIDKETAGDLFGYIYLTNAAHSKEQWDNLSLFGTWVSGGNSQVLSCV